MDETQSATSIHQPSWLLTTKCWGPQSPSPIQPKPKLDHQPHQISTTHIFRLVLLASDRRSTSSAVSRLRLGYWVVMRWRLWARAARGVLLVCPLLLLFAPSGDRIPHPPPSFESRPPLSTMRRLILCADSQLILPHCDGLGHTPC